jgi:hypothetical protein
MLSTSARLEDKRALGVPLYVRLHHILLALCIVLAPLCMAGWFALCPQYGDPTCPSNANPQAALAAFRAADPLLLQIFLGLNLIVPYLYPVGYIGLGKVAMRRAPWLATLGIGFGWFGSIAWGFIADTIFHLNTAVQLGQDTSFIALERSYFSKPSILLIALGWVLGHLGGYLLLGLALLRSRAIPRWSAWLIILSAPLMGPIAYSPPINSGLLQVLGYVLVFVGSIPAARVILMPENSRPAVAASLVPQ